MDRSNILIVEDELIIYMDIASTLQKIGFKNIYNARDSKKALEIASKQKIDILFSDIKIEGDVDGVDTAKILQNLYNMPVIFITAHNDQEILLRASKVDFIGYLLKPYREDELETLIHLSISKFNLLDRSNNLISRDNYTYNKKEQKLYDQNNKEVILTKKEQLFISLLFYNINSIVPYSKIDDIVWFDTYVSDNTRRNLIYRLRNKLIDLKFTLEKNIGIGLL